jgi:DNA-binding response OmpR family regulator
MNDAGVARVNFGLTTGATQVLLADDCADSREVLSLLLRRANFDVVGASDGEEALSLMTQCEPDVLILDIQLPGINGVELARQVRSGGFKGKIIGLSGRSDDATTSNFRAAGGNHFVTKPFDLSQLLRVIESEETTSPLGGS